MPPLQHDPKDCTYDLHLALMPLRHKGVARCMLAPWLAQSSRCLVQAPLVPLSLPMGK